MPVPPRPARPRRRVAWPALALAALLLAPPIEARATAVAEAPWRADAAAYRATLFLANLDPVPWPVIAESWEAPYPGAETARPAIGLFPAADAEAIAAAIAAEDRQALFAAATRAVAGAITERLGDAEAALGTGKAAARLAAARGLYRAIEDGIRAADPEAARRLGLAWLELSTATGSRGVLGAGRTAANPAAFAAARTTIADYLGAEFALADFAPRARLAPIPDSAAGRDLPLAPSLPPGSHIADQTPLPRLELNFEARGIDETDLPLIAYGDMLFDSPEIFGDPARALGIACSTCHNRGDVNRDFRIPGLSHQAGQVDVDGSFFNPLFNDRRDDPLDIPSLRGLRFTGPYGRDGRFASLRDFTRTVIVQEFAGPEPTQFMLDALVAYMLEFDFLPNSKVTPDGRLTDATSDAAHRGAAIFRTPFDGMGGKSCASCHIPSAKFLDRRAHDIGSAAPGYAGDLSGAFDTPTLLGTRFSAPYFHDGSLPTLASVVDWKDRAHALDLDPGEKADLTAYLEAVGDADAPYERFEGRHTPFRLAFEELTTFASTLDTLLPQRDAQHALLMIDTVSADLAADATLMQNAAARPEVHRLARSLARVGEAIRAGDWDDAAAIWAGFKQLSAEIDERMY